MRELHFYTVMNSIDLCVAKLWWLRQGGSLLRDTVLSLWASACRFQAAIPQGQQGWPEEMPFAATGSAALLQGSGFKESLRRLQMRHLGKGPVTTSRAGITRNSLGERHFCMKS